MYSDNMFSLGIYSDVVDSEQSAHLLTDILIVLNGIF